MAAFANAEMCNVPSQTVHGGLLRGVACTLVLCQLQNACFKVVIQAAGVMQRSRSYSGFIRRVVHAEALCRQLVAS
jgi:hypothetical protein